jgi:hypothetical protein
MGGELRGAALASYVFAEAQDGYQVVFSLGELDPAFIDKPLFGAQGGFRLVVPKDKAAARSVRMLTKLEVQLRKQPPRRRASRTGLPIRNSRGIGERDRFSASPIANWQATR